MNSMKATAMSLFALPLLIGAGTAYAGFDFSSTGQTIRQTGAAAPAQIDGSALATPDAVNTKAPALQVFQDKYVPDAIRKKYNLKDDWYGNDQPQTPQPPASQQRTLEIIQDSNAPQSIVPDAVEPVTAVPAPVIQAEPAAVVDTWRARKGENLRDVLQRWSTRGNTNLMWASPDTPVLQKDFSLVGKYQDAVNALIKETGGDKIHSQYRSEGMSPVMMTPASTVTTNAPAPLPPNIAVVPKDQGLLSKVFEPQKKEETKPETRWFGLSGAPLAEVIQVWADDAGVKLVWQSEKNFALKESISRVGHFEDAVFQALSQYDEESIRPVGEMYNDPKSGQQVLLVRTDIKS